MKSHRVLSLLLALGAGLLVASCHDADRREERERELRAMQPRGVGRPDRSVGLIGGGHSDLTQPGAVVRHTCPAEIIDTRTFQPQVQVTDATGVVREIEDMLPIDEGQEEREVPKGPRNALVPGDTLDEGRANVTRLFPTIGATGWNPPDPTLAVGPNHVIVCVNMTLAFYTKTGTLQFSIPLSSAGNPGFFEPLGAGNFTFDPKCFYDHIAQRFVVLALEEYSNQTATIDIAVSDDSDPNGVWYKYRTDDVINLSGNNYWWDYPGLGYDGQAYYVTGNLFSFTSGAPYGGGGFRVFDKAPLLTGSAATYSTLREPGGYVIHPARHFGSNIAPYFTYIVNSTTVRVYSITNPLTSPVLVSTNVTVPSYNGPVNAPTLGGGSMSTGGSTDPVWRNGSLWWCHNASVGGRNMVRWHQFNTGSWPTSGAVTRVQSGDIDAGPGLYTMFPAISVNSAGDVGVSLGATGTDYRVSARVAGRRAGDPPGRMGQPLLVKDGEVNTNGRYGDYYHIAVDPADDTTFWAIGEYPTAGGWQNWVSSFNVGSQSLCHPVSDDAGVFQTNAQNPVTVDVLANDWHSTGLSMTILAFDATSSRGGAVTRSVGTGPGGRDQLTYRPPLNSQGLDSFNYTVTAGSGSNAATAVVAHLYNPANYRVPENPVSTRPGVNAAYYDLTGPQSVPDFSTLTPFRRDVVPNVNYASTTGPFATSTRTDNVGAVFSGYVNIPATDLYQLYVSSDDGSKLYLGSTLLINNDGVHGMTEVSSGLVGLRAGRHLVRVEFFEAAGGAGCIASLSSATITKAAIPASMWSFQPALCTADFDGDGDVGTDADINAFFACIAGNCCTLCGNADFNGDGDVGTDADIEAFFRVLGGGAC
jgi:PA14 domain/Bacterial Ig domain